MKLQFVLNIMFNVYFDTAPCLRVKNKFITALDMSGLNETRSGVGSITHNYINYNYISIFSSITITLIIFQFNYNYNYTVSISITITLCGTKYIQHLLII